MLRKHKKLTKKELKKDPLVIFTAQAVDFLRAEWIKIGSTLLTVLVVVAIAFFVIHGKRKGAVNAYDAALTALNNGAPEAMDLLKRVVDDYGSSRSAGEALIKLGNSYFQNNDYNSAEQYYKQYIDKFTDDAVFLYNAYNGLGGVYEEKGDFRKAGETYEEYIKKNKNSVFLPAMYLNAGKAYYQSGDKDAAKRNFDRIVEDYEDTKEKQEASFFLDLMK